MCIRSYNADDGRYLGDMLLAEGLKPDDMCFSSNATFVYDDGIIKGFYTYRIEDVFPHLQHFCVDSEYRNMNVARTLIKDFREKMKDLGYSKAIINSPLCKEYINIIVKWYFKIQESYGADDNHRFYLVRL